MLSLAIPAQIAAPAVKFLASNAASVARPALSIGIVALLIFVFKPLLTGLLRAALLVVKPRASLEERSARTRAQSIEMLNRTAREYDATQPGFAAELRFLASRG